LDNELGRSVAAEYSDVAAVAKRPFIPIYLHCDILENKKRIASPERVNSGTTKLVNYDLLQDWYDKYELVRFAEFEGLDLDSTDITPLEAASKILAFVNQQSAG
jgi:hypothetical protein